MKKIVQKADAKKTPEPAPKGRPMRSNRQKIDPAPAKGKDDEIIGVKVVDSSMAPDPRKVNQNLQPMEEEKKQVNAEPTVAELQKKKAGAKKAQFADSEGAFNLYIYRVLKAQCPEFTISKKAMRSLNSINAEKFKELMSECRNLVINTKKQTLSSKEVETACKLTIFGELGQNAVAEGRQALREHHEMANQ